MKSLSVSDVALRALLAAPPVAAALPCSALCRRCSTAAAAAAALGTALRRRRSSCCAPLLPPRCLWMPPLLPAARRAASPAVPCRPNSLPPCCFPFVSAVGFRCFRGCPCDQEGSHHDQAPSGKYTHAHSAYSSVTTPLRARSQDWRSHCVLGGPVLGPGTNPAEWTARSRTLIVWCAAHHGDAARTPEALPRESLSCVRRTAGGPRDAGELTADLLLHCGVFARVCAVTRSRCPTCMCASSCSRSDRARSSRRSSTGAHYRPHTRRGPAIGRRRGALRTQAIQRIGSPRVGTHR